MKVVHTLIEGCFLLEPTVFEDARGYFVERFNAETFRQATKLDVQFVQDNESKSTKGVARGLHMQVGPMAQAKLVHVPLGAVLDVVVDLRKDSPSFLKHITVPLNECNKHMLYIPVGCAHGFCVHSDQAIFQYKCSNFYSKAHEAGVYLFDEQLGIDFGLPQQQLLLSDKDAALPRLTDFDFSKLDS